ncbi:MarR family winged helix-turn-helix transcriptional regulator [Streptomyces griseorubiginosus]|uniref:MarR family winged helix-turn-helix transcriptional regulator n=1 Tax=Streptomyces griseorubiginosus TaxID=67304 RepID=UPI00365AC925
MQEAPTGTDVRAYEALALFARLLETSVNRALQREFGITWDEYAVLSLLHRSPHQFLHMTEAATALGFSRSRVTRAVTRQEIHGRVIRSACPRDARATHATVTEQGSALLYKTDDTYRAAVRQSLTKFSIGVEHTDVLVKLLEPLCDLRSRPRSQLTCARSGRTTAANSSTSRP